MEKNFSKREQNKTQHKTAIVEAAEKLFLANGFDNTSIDDVAKAAKLTKRTLYQYFTSKEDLYFSVALKGARILTAAYEEGLERGGTALEKIRLANEVYLQFYRDYFGLFRILNYQPSNQANNLASPHFREMMTIDAIRMRHYAELVDEGGEDGSINPNLDTRKAVFFAFFSAFSLLYAVSATGAAALSAMGLDEQDFLKFSFDLLANALK